MTAVPKSAAPAATPELRRELTPLNGILASAGAMIGSGIFATPHDVAPYVKDPVWFLGLWVVGGLVSLLGALTFAELGAARPLTGGLYVYLREAFGPLVGFVFGWAMLSILLPSSIAYFAQVTGDYVEKLLPIPARATGVAVIAIVLVANLVRGAKSGAALQDLFTVAKYAGLVLLAGVGIYLAATSAPQGPSIRGAPLVVPAIAALVPILWAYDGWMEVTSIAGELKRPERWVPRSLIVSTAAVTLIYLVVNVVYIATLGTNVLGETKTPAADVAAHVFGNGGRLAATALVGISTFGCCAVSLMTGARVVFALGADGSLFGWLGKKGRSGGPDNAVIITSLLAIGYLLLPQLGTLAEMFVIGAWPFYAVGAFAVFVQRRRNPDAPRPFRLPLYPLPMIVFAVASIAIVGSYAVANPAHTAVSFGIILLGVPIYFGIQFARARKKT